ncbi:hypothetical protein LJY25_16895 [Hymenobacter sp. BT175]|uniref:hypothetical protein n=1 Tax=Hymenobacter translucens TaxID=2886507 RepID=UPI001D0F0AAA|nr:hypothetical protein [Hymenobacter translucens]MCC2548130.1 hypothetical protein [Hymenobacter translucens]
MLRLPLSWFLVLASTLLLSACCGSVSCECGDGYDNALFFRFNLDSTSTRGFSSADLDTVYLKRYAIPVAGSAASRPDSVRIIRPRSAAAQPVIINVGQPFLTGNRLDAYTYDLYLGKSFQLSQARARYRIEAVKLQGELVGNGCCTCYRNRRKTLTLTSTINGQATTLPYDLTDPAGEDQPVYVTLSR